MRIIGEVVRKQWIPDKFHLHIVKPGARSSQKYHVLLDSCPFEVGDVVGFDAEPHKGNDELFIANFK